MSNNSRIFSDPTPSSDPALHCTTLHCTVVCAVPGLVLPDLNGVSNSMCVCVDVCMCIRMCMYACA